MKLLLRLTSPSHTSVIETYYNSPPTCRQISNSLLRLEIPQTWQSCRLYSNESSQASQSVVQSILVERTSNSRPYQQPHFGLLSPQMDTLAISSRHKEKPSRWA